MSTCVVLGVSTCVVLGVSTCVVLVCQLVTIGCVTPKCLLVYQLVLLVCKILCFNDVCQLMTITVSACVYWFIKLSCWCVNLCFDDVSICIKKDDHLITD